MFGVRVGRKVEIFTATTMIQIDSFTIGSQTRLELMNRNGFLSILHFQGHLLRKIEVFPIHSDTSSGKINN